jgi:hypothetical protein
MTFFVVGDFGYSPHYCLIKGVLLVHIYLNIIMKLTDIFFILYIIIVISIAYLDGLNVGSILLTVFVVYTYFSDDITKLFPAKKKLDLTPPKGLSHFRFTENVTYGMRDRNLSGGNEIEWGVRSAQSLRVDDFGVIREWWFEAYIITKSGPLTLSVNKGKATIYRIREGNTVVKCTAAADDERGVGYIKYNEEPIGIIAHVPSGEWNPVIITDYS